MDNENKALDQNETKEPLKKEKKKKEKGKNGKSGKVSFIIGIVICVILVPILIINSILIVKGIGDDREPPSIFGYTPLTVLTESMSPLIDAGDLIFLKEIKPEDVKIGDVICFFDPAEDNGDFVLTHRVVDFVRDENGNPVRNDEGYLEVRTAGDFNLQGDYDEAVKLKDKKFLETVTKVEDPNEEGYSYWYTTDEKHYDSTPVPLNDETIIGVYAYSGIPFVGSISTFMSKPYGWAVCIGVPLLAFVLFEVLSRRKNDKTKKKDMDALLAELEALKAAKAASEQTNVSEETAENADAEVADATETADPPSEEQDLDGN